MVTVSTGWCTKLWQFVMVRSLEGVGEVFYFPASNALIADYHGMKTRSKALSLHQSAVYVGTIIGSWLGAWLAEHYGWRYGFYLLGGVGMLFSWVLYYFLKEPYRGASEKKPSLAKQCDNLQESEEDLPALFFTADEESLSAPSSAKESLKIIPTLCELIKRPAVLLLMLAFASATFVTAVFLTWMPTFLYEKFSLGLALAGFLSVITIQTASVVSVLGAGWVVDRLILKMPYARVLMQLVCLLLGIGAIIAVGQVSHLRILIIAMVFFGFFKGGYDGGLYAALYDYVEPKLRGAAAGLMVTFGWGGGAIGALVVGALSSHGSGSSVERMSHAITWSAPGNLIAACLLVGVLFIKPQTK